MNSFEVGARLVAGTMLILANGFFVAIEFALTRARQFTEDEFVDDTPALERAWEMTQNLEIYLTTCQVGITASSIAVGIVAWLETEEDAIESRADLRNRLGSVLERGDLSDERRDEVMNALYVGEQSVREVMVPPEEIVALSTEADADENFRRMSERPQTRYPLVGGDLTDFVGIVYTPVLVRHRETLTDDDIDFTELAAPPMTLSPDTDVSDAIDQFQTENQELALVVEDGEVVGLVTVTDLLESIMGDIEDPLDKEQAAVDGNA